MPTISVLGLGNVLIGDDALGPYVVRRFAAEYEVGDDVQVLDFGTPGFDLAPFLMDAPTVIIVDTVRSQGEPGELRFYDKADILRVPLQQRVNPHDPGLKDTLLLLDMQGVGPQEVRFIGVIPQNLMTGVGMTKALYEAVPRVMEALVQELTRLGHPPRRRRVPEDADLWWETPALSS
jgi:hydrogenase maturation protease